jgi:hypothetical protein
VPSGVRERPPESLTFETWLDDGSLVLGGVELDDATLILTVNSRTRCDLGRTLLSRTLGELVGQPLVETETIAQLMASRDAGLPQQQDIPEDQACAIIHDRLDRHYRAMASYSFSWLWTELGVDELRG